MPDLSTGRVAEYTPPPEPRTPPQPTRTRRPYILAELPPADYPAEVVIGTALEGLDGYDGGTRDDLAKLPAMPGGWRIVRDPSDPEQAARELLAQVAPEKSLERNAAGQLRIVDKPAPKPKATAEKKD